MCAQVNLPAAQASQFLCRCGTYFVEASTAIDPLSVPFAAQSPTLSLRQPGKMSSPPSEHPLAASFNFLLEFLPAVDFSEAFRFDAPFDFDDFGEGNRSYGSYEDNSCSLSVESSVRLRRRRRRRKRRSLIVCTAGRAFFYPVGTRIFFSLV